MPRERSSSSKISNKPASNSNDEDSFDDLSSAVKTLLDCEGLITKTEPSHSKFNINQLIGEPVSLENKSKKEETSVKEERNDTAFDNPIKAFKKIGDRFQSFLKNEEYLVLNSKFDGANVEELIKNVNETNWLNIDGEKYSIKSFYLLNVDKAVHDNENLFEMNETPRLSYEASIKTSVHASELKKNEASYNEDSVTIVLLESSQYKMLRTCFLKHYINEIVQYIKENPYFEQFQSQIIQFQNENSDLQFSQNPNFINQIFNLMLHPARSLSSGAPFKVEPKFKREIEHICGHCAQSHKPSKMVIVTLLPDFMQPPSIPKITIEDSQLKKTLERMHDIFKYACCEFLTKSYSFSSVYNKLNEKLEKCPLESLSVYEANENDEEKIKEKELPFNNCIKQIIINGENYKDNKEYVPFQKDATTTNNTLIKHDNEKEFTNDAKKKIEEVSIDLTKNETINVETEYCKVKNNEGKHQMESKSPTKGDNESPLPFRIETKIQFNVNQQQTFIAGKKVEKLPRKTSTSYCVRRTLKERAIQPQLNMRKREEKEEETGHKSKVILIPGAGRLKDLLIPDFAMMDYYNFTCCHTTTGVRQLRVHIEACECKQNNHKNRSRRYNGLSNNNVVERPCTDWYQGCKSKKDEHQRTIYKN